MIEKVELLQLESCRVLQISLEPEAHTTITTGANRYISVFGTTDEDLAKIAAVLPKKDVEDECIAYADGHADGHAEGYREGYGKGRVAGFTYGYEYAFSELKMLLIKQQADIQALKEQRND